MQTKTGCQVILVRYISSKGSKPYAYLVPPWLEPVDVGDVLVAEARNTIALVKVTTITPTQQAASFASAYVITKLDLQEHYDQVKELTGI